MPDPMPLKDVIIELSELHKAMDARTKKAEALAESIRILAAMAGEGCTDFDTVLDVLHDYQSLVKQYRNMHSKYELQDKPKHKNGVWLCPACSGRVQSYHSHCPRCGKRIGWS